MDDISEKTKISLTLPVVITVVMFLVSMVGAVTMNWAKISPLPDRVKLLERKAMIAQYYIHENCQTLKALIRYNVPRKSRPEVNCTRGIDWKASGH